MPIHDQGYRRYRGSKAPLGQGWTVIARAGIRNMFGKKAFLGLLLLSWFPFFVRAVQFYAAANLPQAALLAPSAETFRQFLAQQDTFVFFVAVYVGAGLIANDRRANALQIYLSKPLTRAEYVAGKVSILVVFLLLVTWAPAMLLLVVQMLFQGSLDFIRAHAMLFPAITLYSLLQVLLASFTILALSSLSNSSRFVAVLYAGAVLFSDAVYNVLYAVTGNTSFSWISFGGNLRQVGNVIFRMRPVYPDTPWLLSLVMVVGMIAVSMVILDRRVRGVEVVS